MVRRVGASTRAGRLMRAGRLALAAAAAGGATLGMLGVGGVAQPLPQAQSLGRERPQTSAHRSRDRVSRDRVPRHRVPFTRVKVRWMTSRAMPARPWSSDMARAAPRRARAEGVGPRVAAATWAAEVGLWPWLPQCCVG